MTEEKKPIIEIEELRKMTADEIGERSDNLLIISESGGVVSTYSKGFPQAMLSSLMTIMFEILYQEKVKEEKRTLNKLLEKISDKLEKKG